MPTSVEKMGERKLSEALQQPPPQQKVIRQTWRFYPSHLTKGLVGSGFSIAFAMYAGWQFARVGKDEYPPPPPIK